MGKHTIRLLGISGSPRAAATDYAIREALRYAEEKYDVETAYFTVTKKKINFCIHCDFCIRKKEGCVFKDDMQEVYQLLKWADAYIIGSPVYQGTISGQLKTLFDRTRAILAQDIHVFENKVGAGIAIGGDRVGGRAGIKVQERLFLDRVHVLRDGPPIDQRDQRPVPVLPHLADTPLPVADRAAVSAQAAPHPAIL